MSDPVVSLLSMERSSVYCDEFHKAIAYVKDLIRIYLRKFGQIHGFPSTVPAHFVVKAQLLEDFAGHVRIRKLLETSRIKLRQHVTFNSGTSCAFQEPAASTSFLALYLPLFVLTMTSPEGSRDCQLTTASPNLVSAPAS